jgi:hypothetical protein
MHLNVLSNVRNKWLVCYALRMCLMLQTANQFTNEDAGTTNWSMYVNFGS